jgi:hypothetical protein
MRNPLLGRKFLVGMYALTGAFVLALLNKLTSEYATVASIVVGSFSAADAYITGKHAPGSTGSTTEK